MARVGAYAFLKRKCACYRCETHWFVPTWNMAQSRCEQCKEGSGEEHPNLKPCFTTTTETATGNAVRSK